MIEALYNFADRVKQVNLMVDKIALFIMTLSIMGIFGIVVVAVFFRYVVGNALGWSEEVAKFTLVWMCFIGISAVMIRKGHVGIHIILDKLTGFFKVLMVIFTELVVLITLLGLLWYSWDITLGAFPQRSQPVPWLSLGTVYISMPLGALLTIPVSLEQFARKLADSLALLKGMPAAEVSNDLVQEEGS